MSILKAYENEKGVVIQFEEQNVLVEDGTLKLGNEVIAYLKEAFNGEDALKNILEKNPENLSKIVNTAVEWLEMNPEVNVDKDLPYRDLWVLKSKMSDRIGISVVSYASPFSPRYISLAVTLDGLFNGEIVMSTTIEAPIEKFDVVLLDSLYTHIIDQYGSEEIFINTISDEENYETNREKYEELLYNFTDKICEV